MKTEFAHEILQSCEKLNQMGNSQTVHLCAHLCICSKTAHSVPAKKFACYNEGFVKVKSGLS